MTKAEHQMAEKNLDVDSSGAPEDTATKPSAETMRAGEKDDQGLDSGAMMDWHDALSNPRIDTRSVSCEIAIQASANSSV